MSWPGLERARVLLGSARDALTFTRRSGILRSFGPLDLAHLARDATRCWRRGGLALIHAHAVADPLRPAIVSGELRLSYGELDARVNRLTHAFGSLGVGPGERVGMFLRNGHEFMEVQLALSALGGIGVQIGSRLKADEVGYILGNAGVRALFFDHELVAVVEATLARGGLTRQSAISTRPVPGFVDYETFLTRGRADVPRAVDGTSWGGNMIYTSGTTGRGKGARRDFRNISWAPIFSMLRLLPIRRDERHLVVCPLYHSLAAMFTIPVVVLGGCLVIHERYEPAEVLRTIERERINSMLVVPTMLQRLVALSDEEFFRHDTGSLRWIISGAAPLPTEVARRVEDRLGPILYNLYGATETGLVTLACPGEHTARPGTIGRALGGASIRLLGADGRKVADGEVGELYVRSGMLMDAYHGDEASTRAAMRDGYLSVGDLARRDTDGYYYLADRKIDMVISGGVNIYPWEIEQRLHEHPAIAEAAVIGVPDPEWGESLVAWVVPRGVPPSAEALGAFVVERLADYKRPRQVMFVDALPRTPTGKVLKRELCARYAADHPTLRPSGAGH
jgi:fatty-acyl-CoA synthase